MITECCVLWSYILRGGISVKWGGGKGSPGFIILDDECLHLHGYSGKLRHLFAQVNPLVCVRVYSVLED